MQVIHRQSHDSVKLIEEELISQFVIDWRQWEIY